MAAKRNGLINATAASSSITFGDKGAVLADVQVISSDDSGAGPYAIECMLQACNKTYSATSTNGQFYEVELASWTNNSNVNPDTPSSQGGVINYYFTPPEQPLNYNISASALNDLYPFVLAFFHGSAIVEHWISLERTTFGTAQLLAIYNAMLPTGNRNTTTFPALMDNLVQSTTVVIRTTGNGPGFHGSAWEYETFIHVS